MPRGKRRATRARRHNLAALLPHTSGDAEISDDSAAQSMVEMGFAVEHVTRALEQTSFAFGRALLLLLNG
eukprot:11217747-Lingulodinium_polyedra.AAC.1